MKTLKEYEVVFKNKAGMGYILPSDVNIEDFIESKPVIIGLETIQPNTETTLYGYFNISPALYLGMLNNEMIFYMGKDSDLFENRKYYIALVKLTETRIFSMFSYGAGRDFNLRNNIWK